MTVAARVQPETFFTAAQWAQVSGRSNWRGLWLVAHCWASIGLAIWLGVMWPVTIPFMVMFIGNRQLGLFILMHDAAHAALHANRGVNDWVGKWLCGFDLQRYRPYHLTHHRFVQQAEDPDLVLSAPFPITPTSLRRKMLRDLSGQTFFKQRVAPFFIALRQREAGVTWQSVCAKELRDNGMFWLGNAAGLAVFAAAGLAWAWVLLWLLPMATWLPLISRLRNISEHALVAQNEPNPLRHARTTHANLIERLLIAPYWVNYHCEHHMFTHIPCWNLSAAHRLLADQGAVARMETQPGYEAMLRLATAAGPAAPMTGH
jgi:fatty acid desaturase